MLRVLDFYCAAGVGARGMIQAGATVTGVDIKRFKRYPGIQLTADIPKLRKDAKFIAWARSSFDFVWASPPCQFGSALKYAPGAKKHSNLIPATRELLDMIGLPYTIENVEGAQAHLIDPITLCGSMFNLGCAINGEWFQLERHRCFETSIGFKPRQPKCRHNDRATIGVYGSHARIRAASIPGGRGTSWPFRVPQRVAAEIALGVERQGLTLAEMSQGIPPAYAAYILRSFKRQRAA